MICWIQTLKPFATDHHEVNLEDNHLSHCWNYLPVFERNLKKQQTIKNYNSPFIVIYKKVNITALRKYTAIFSKMLFKIPRKLKIISLYNHYFYTSFPHLKTNSFFVHFQKNFFSKEIFLSRQNFPIKLLDFLAHISRIRSCIILRAIYKKKNSSTGFIMNP